MFTAVKLFLTLQVTVMVGTCQNVWNVQHPRVNPKCQLWAVGGNDQCKFAACNRYTPLVQMLIMGEAVHVCIRGYMGKEIHIL